MKSALGIVASFVWKRRNYWLIPLVSVLILMALMVVLNPGSGLGLLDYKLF